MKTRHAAVALTLLAGGWKTRPPACPGNNAGLTLPDGFCATVFADSVGRARHIVALPNGTIAVAVDGQRGGIMILHDADNDGVADRRFQVGPRGGTGIAFYHDHVYFGLNNAVLRFPIPDHPDTSLRADTVVSGLPFGSQHSAKNIAIDAHGNLFVNIGAPSNDCQQQDRTERSPGMDPCPILDTAGGIWRFDANRTGQGRADGHRYATGLRNVVALGVDPANDALYGVQHGRDDIARLWPGVYPDPETANAEKPGEELFRLEDGGNYGWPYCYYDPDLHEKVLNPEYGGDGHTAGRCAQMKQPLMAFPAHYAPDGIAFYRGRSFPSQYRGGLFIAFHGSWNRAPRPQEGYNVVFVPFSNGRPSGNWTVFAEGFRGDRSGNAQNRPVGIAVGPDGSMYVTSDQAPGRVYRITYAGR